MKSAFYLSSVCIFLQTSISSSGQQAEDLSDEQLVSIFIRAFIFLHAVKCYNHSLFFFKLFREYKTAQVEDDIAPLMWYVLCFFRRHFFA